MTSLSMLSTSRGMIAQGTDGLSRGIFLEGVVRGEDMLVKSWVAPILGDSKLLVPEEWFHEGHGIIGGKKDSTGLWIPQHPGNAKVYICALEECTKAIHKRTDAYHIFLIPRLYSPLWTRISCSNSRLAHRTGLRPCTNLYLLAFHSHSSTGTLGPFDERRCWWN